MNWDRVEGQWKQRRGKAGLIAVLPLFLLIAGCSKDDTAVGPTPIVIPL